MSELVGKDPPGRSEAQLQRQLDLPRPELILHNSKGGIVDDLADQIVARVVGQIEELRAELQASFLRCVELKRQ